MRARCLMLQAWVCGTLLALTASPERSVAQTPQGRPVSAADSDIVDPDKVIASLRQLASDLTDAVKRFQTHLDQEIALHDRGYRTESGRRIPAADADFNGGSADAVLTAKRKLFAARMISARRPGYEPAALADSDRIQVLILEARSRVKLGDDVMPRFLLISARELNSAVDAELRVRRQALLKARSAAMEAAKKALVALPVELPGADSPGEQRERAWDLIAKGLPADQNDGSSVRGLPPQRTPEDAVVLPIRLEQGKKITLVHERFHIITLTDSGMEDRQGRRLFYQEEWEQRQGTTTMKRWAVAVNTTTGQHALLRRYEVREFRDVLDAVYPSQGRDYLSPAELPEASSAPSMHEMTSAMTEAAHSREELRDALLDFKREIREALGRNDALLAAQNKPALDDELPNDMRENLFAIRGHLAGTTDILDAENKVRSAVERAAGKVRILEALVAWVNGNALEREGPEHDSRALLEAVNRSDTEIASTRFLEMEALAALPPDTSRPEAQFPALMKDAIVRIRGVRAPAGPGESVRYRQELWRLAGWVRGDRQVKRTIVLIDIESETGSQIPADREVKYYLGDTGDTLEEIYDENAAQ